jgi:2-dehydro-3-deoxygluconokinase
MTRRFVSIGEAMVELAPQGNGCYRAGFAGDTLNTAWYLCSRQPPGWSVGYVTLLGDDPFSIDLREFIAKAGIESSVPPDGVNSAGSAG